MSARPHNYDEARELTALSLLQLSETEQLTYLSLPERTALIEEVSRVVPAGNVPSLIAAGLANLGSRIVPPGESRRHLNLLMQGMQTFMDRAVFRTFFAGPATILAAYQMLLKLTGKDLDQSFPEGTWQFYVEFGLREDSSLHACETLGFQEALNGKKLSAVDELVAWVMASAWLLDSYPALLTQDWTERVRLRQLGEAIGDNRLIDRWLKVRPYRAPNDGDYLAHRQNMFERFCNYAVSNLNPRQARQIETRWQHEAKERAPLLDAYLRQMTILAALQPGEHSDSRVPIPPGSVHLAVIHAKRYFLIDLTTARSLSRARAMCAAILHFKPSGYPTATLDRALRTTPRREQLALRRVLSEAEAVDLERLRTAPIILNWDVSKATLLSAIRQGQRGIGDHALTLFRTPRSTVFDLSHIFFDGVNGVAISEILTGQAIRLAREALRRPESAEDDPTMAAFPAVRALLNLHAPQPLVAQARKLALPAETSAESSGVRLDLLQDVRRTLGHRNAKLRLTVNDLLVLYRALFGPLYLPSPELTRQLALLASGSLTSGASASIQRAAGKAAQLALSALDMARVSNPVLLIPMDATRVDPRERVYPATLRMPFPAMMEQHRRALEAVRAPEIRGLFNSGAAAVKVRETRREYLAALQAFGEWMAANKDVSMRGESIGTQTIKLLAGLPPSVQRLLDSLPSRFDVVNDVVKGQEVFSNVGQVSPESSLSRFNTAKDDNEKKTLAWGVLTDARGMMHISLRDFRPHVTALAEVKQFDLAQAMTQDFLDKYVAGLNQFLDELLTVARARGSVE